MNDTRNPGRPDPDNVDPAGSAPDVDGATGTDSDGVASGGVGRDGVDSDEVDPELERHVAAALRDAYPVEPVSDDDIIALRAHLGSTVPSAASAPAPTATILHDRWSRHRSRPGRTGLLVAAAVAVVALIGVSTSLWSTAAPDQTPATVPPVTVTTSDTETTLPPTTTATTATTATTVTTDPAVTSSGPTGTEAGLPATGEVQVTLTSPDATPTPADPAPTVVTPTPTSEAAAPTISAADPQRYRVDDSRYEVSGMIEFTSPSANIYCLMADQGVPGASCQVFQAAFATLSCPDETGAANLGLVFSVDGAGQTSDGSVTTADTVGHFGEACGYGLVLAPGAPPASAPVLDYSRSLTLGAFTCVSETTGVTCRNDVSGAGFSVSRAAYRLF